MSETLVDSPALHLWCGGRYDVSLPGSPTSRVSRQTAPLDDASLPGSPISLESRRTACAERADVKVMSERQITSTRQEIFAALSEFRKASLASNTVQEYWNRTKGQILIVSGNRMKQCKCKRIGSAVNRASA